MAGWRRQKTELPFGMNSWNKSSHAPFEDYAVHERAGPGQRLVADKNMGGSLLRSQLSGSRLLRRSLVTRQGITAPKPRCLSRLWAYVPQPDGQVGSLNHGRERDEKKKKDGTTCHRSPTPYQKCKRVLPRDVEARRQIEMARRRDTFRLSAEITYAIFEHDPSGYERKTQGAEASEPKTQHDQLPRKYKYCMMNQHVDLHPRTYVGYRIETVLGIGRR
ncbi:hypothetical protein BC827DRAFT_1288531 [Russula dissimulans]|nr:hypothetical protein BC827DRAFT_1288531 [Russula dissimulans]